MMPSLRVFDCQSEIEKKGPVALTNGVRNLAGLRPDRRATKHLALCVLMARWFTALQSGPCPTQRNLTFTRVGFHLPFQRHRDPGVGRCLRFARCHFTTIIYWKTNPDGYFNSLN